MDHLKQAAEMWDGVFQKLGDKPLPPKHTEADRPAGCKCDPTDWSQFHPIPAVCTQWESDPNMPTVCVGCEHHQECHR